jgi:hypothetical protein
MKFSGSLKLKAMLTSLECKIEIKEEPEFAGETFEERYDARITAFDYGLTTR